MTTTEIVNTILAARKNSADAYDRVLPEMRAISPERVRALNASVPTAVAIVLGAAPRIAAFQTAITRELPAFSAKIEKLDDYAYALHEAHVRALSTGRTELPILADEGESLRATLRSDATALVNRGIIDEARLSACTWQVGYKTIATDLAILATVMLSSWSNIRGKCCVTEDELRRAQRIAETLLALVGEREQASESKAEAIDLRNRAFSLLADSYDEARRAVSYLRWAQGDADEIAPSLFGGKRRPRSDKNDEPSDEQPVPVGASAVPTSNPVTNATPATSSPAVNAVPASSSGPNAAPFV